MQTGTAAGILNKQKEVLNKQRHGNKRTVASTHAGVWVHRDALARFAARTVRFADATVVLAGLVAGQMRNAAYAQQREKKSRKTAAYQHID